MEGEQGRLVAEILEAAPRARIVALAPRMRQGRRVEDLLEAIREPPEGESLSPAALRLLVLFQGHYGQHILEHVRQAAPPPWTVNGWRVPSALPQLLSDALAFLPTHLPAADLVLSLGESPGVAQLLPNVAERCGARAVIAPVDDAAWLPDGLIRLLRTRLMERGVTAAFPKPFCSLTEHSYNMRQQEVSYESAQIRQFARYFGRPSFRISCDQGRIARVEVERDAACGCAQAIAWRLVGLDAQEAVEQVAFFQRRYPCLAAKRIDPSLGQSLLQAAIDLMQDAVARNLPSSTTRFDHRDLIEQREGTDIP